MTTDALHAWAAFLTALGALVATIVGIWSSDRSRRASAEAEARQLTTRQRIIGLIHDLAPGVVLTVERLAAATPTKKDDEALARIRSAVASAGDKIPPDLLDYAREVLAGEYQAYKVHTLGIPAHVDGAEAKAQASAEGKASAGGSSPEA